MNESDKRNIESFSCGSTYAKKNQNEQDRIRNEMADKHSISEDLKRRAAIIEARLDVMDNCSIHQGR